VAAHSKSVSSHRMIRGSGWALESRPNRCLQPAKPDNRHFRDYPLTGHAADMPKSALLNSEKVMRVYGDRIAAIERFTVGFSIAIMLTDRNRSACTTHLIRNYSLAGMFQGRR
jgi:hypothetical protein